MTDNDFLRKELDRITGLWIEARDKLNVAVNALQFILDKNQRDPGVEALKEEYNVRAARTYDKAWDALTKLGANEFDSNQEVIDRIDKANQDKDNLPKVVAQERSEK